MRSESPIQVCGLSKCYAASSRLRAQSLSESLATGVKALASKAKGLFSGSGGKREEDIFWALKDVSFELEKGEVLGVIGKNGAGKSTLLKTLSRITPPTAGEIRIKGRMASLLEVGTGFHPELTGRENIFLNGAILGMSQSEIRRKFDAIVEFSEIGQFIDMAVKRYSSGMYVRLAFSVAAHLDPEILVLDEVLSVGDTAFQRKCIGAMKEVTSRNRTVIFVSHNLPLVRRICSRVMLLEQGKVVTIDTPEAAISQYLRRLESAQAIGEKNLSDRLNRSLGKVRFTAVQTYDVEGRERWRFSPRETVHVRLDYKVYEPVPNLAFSFKLTSPTADDLILTNIFKVVSETPLPAGEEGTIHLTFPDLPLVSGDYGYLLHFGDKDWDKSYDAVDRNIDLPLLSIVSSDKDPAAEIGYFHIPVRVETRAGATSR